MIRLEHLAFSYTSGDFGLEIPGLEVQQGTKVALVGPSGYGKTTLLHLIAGILIAQSGTVQVGGVDLNDYSERDLLDYRIATMGLIFQEFKLLEYLSVLDNILLPFRLNPILQMSPETRSKATELAGKVGLGEKLDRYPKNLSQGERQRVALCRALITGPSLLLCDEPTANLDPGNRDRILDLLFEYCQRQQASLVMVTHDPEVLDRFDRKIDVSAFLATSKTSMS